MSDEDEGPVRPVPVSGARHRARRRLIDYPRRGRRGVRRWIPSFKLMAACTFGFVAALVGAFFIALALVRIPQPNDFATSQATLFDYADGHTQIAHVGTNRVSVPFAQIPADVRDAVLAAEDRSFYSEPGISVLGTLRALRNDLTGSGDLQGGSTVTQQYVKNYYLTQKQTIGRKFTEALLSVKIDDEVSKDTILQNYLNTVYFSRGSYGIQTASRAYFGVPVANLAHDPAKAAYLAALLQSPYFYSNADTDPAAAKALQARWNYVLNGMVTEGWLSSAQRATLTFPKTVPYQPNDLAGTNGYMVNAATGYLDTMHGTNPNVPDATMIAQGGYTVVTTFQPAYMKAANQVVADQLTTLKATNPADRDVHVGLAAVDNDTGAVVGFYGGPNYVTQGFNDAMQAKGPIGSTVAGPLLQRTKGITAGQGWPAVVTALAQHGITDVTPKDDPPSDDDLTATPLGLAAAFAATDKQGVYNAPYEVAEVLQGGQVIWQAPQPTNPPSAFLDQFDVWPWQAVAGHDGADQWAWSVAGGPKVSVAVDMYATKPNHVTTRSLKGMSAPGATSKTTGILFEFVKSSPIEVDPVITGSKSQVGGG
jgi:membrane peptidoglycan carboxypeptidase